MTNYVCMYVRISKSADDFKPITQIKHLNWSRGNSFNLNCSHCLFTIPKYVTKSVWVPVSLVTVS